MIFEWRDILPWSDNIVYCGSFWLKEKFIANLAVVRLIIEGRYFYQVHSSCIFGDESCILSENAEGFSDLKVRTIWVMDLLYEKTKIPKNMQEFEYHCLSLDWLRKNARYTENSSAKEKCRLLFPLLKVEEVPDLMILLDKFLENGSSSYEL